MSTMEITELEALHRDLELRSFLGDANILHDYYLLTKHPLALNNDLALLACLAPSYNLYNAMLSDLLINGEDGVAHGKLREFAQGLSSQGGGNTLGDNSKAALESIRSWAESVAGPASTNVLVFKLLIAPIPLNSSRSPEGIAVFVNEIMAGFAAKKHLSSTVTSLEGIRSESLEEHRPKLEAALEFFEEGVMDPWGEKTKQLPAWTLLQHQDMVNEASLLELYNLAEEYNWEWALAAHEWSPGTSQEDTYQGQLQAIVDASPWYNPRG